MFINARDHSITVSNFNELAGTRVFINIFARRVGPATVRRKAGGGAGGRLAAL